MRAGALSFLWAIAVAARCLSDVLVPDVAFARGSQCSKGGRATLAQTKRTGN